MHLICKVAESAGKFWQMVSALNITMMIETEYQDFNTPCNEVEKCKWPLVHENIG